MVNDIDLHNSQPVLTAGEPLESAKAVMIMIHGRGASAEDILTLTPHFNIEGFAYLALQATNSTWYPQRFLVPQNDNEPWLSSAKKRIDDALQMALDAGISTGKIIFLGFSQGACLATEYPARNPQRYGGIIALSGGLIGTDDEITGYIGSLDGTPAFLGCSDVDFHIPKERVQATADVLKNIGGDVTIKLYAGMGHTINEDEIAHVKQIMTQVLES
jgi:phospholipase/carboxylesterase